MFLELLFSLFLAGCTAAYEPPEKLISNEADLPPCPGGWDYYSKVNKCFLRSQFYKSWDDANVYCHNVTGGELPSIVSQQDYDVFRAYALQNYPAYPVWIGLYNRKDVSFNSYRWTDGNYYNLSKWIPNEPVNPKTSCFAFKTIDAENGYKSVDCKYKQPFICQQRSANCLSSTYNGSQGTVQSPNYPDNYDNNLNCYYHVTAPAGMIINVTITDFYIDVLDDVYIYDGPDDGPNSYLLMKLYGKTVAVENYFETTSNELTIKFVTGNTGVERGWLFTWTAIQAQPTNSYNAIAGTITSPNYPADYDKHTNRLYQITVPEGNIIDFYVTAFVTENNFDYLRIANGVNPRQVSNKIVQLSSNLTGNGTVPTHFFSASNVASMLFYADASVTRSGWSLTYTATQPL